MKDTTKKWMEDRIKECYHTLKRMDNDGKNLADRAYYGVCQELNTLKRILKMEE